MLNGVKHLTERQSGAATRSEMLPFGQHDIEFQSISMEFMVMLNGVKHLDEIAVNTPRNTAPFAAIDSARSPKRHELPT